MTKEMNLQELSQLRLLVAFLGEKSQYNWWQTSFFGATGSAVLGYAFPRTTLLAQYSGASEAARRLHDEHIGVGRVFHLFRLPEEIEQDMHRLVKDGNAELADDVLVRSESAENALHKLARGCVESGESTFILGSRASLEDPEIVGRMAALYLSAFREHKNVYPYFQASA